MANELRLSPSGPLVNPQSLLVTSVQNIAALIAWSGAMVGQNVRVESLGRLFNAAPAGTNVPQPCEVIDSLGSPAVQWHSLNDTSDDKWLDQLDWYIDGVVGDDENPGSLARPIKTDSERARRWGTYPMLRTAGVRTVHLLSTPADNQVFVRYARSNVDARVDISDASPRVVLAAGQLATYAAYSVAANEATVISVTGIADWTLLIGKRVNFGAQGIARVAAVNPGGLGVSFARITKPQVASVDGWQLPTDGVPVIGAGVTVEELGVQVNHVTVESMTAFYRVSGVFRQFANINGIRVGRSLVYSAPEEITSTGVRVWDCDVRELRGGLMGARQWGGSLSQRASGTINHAMSGVLLNRGPVNDGLQDLVLRDTDSASHDSVVSQAVRLLVYGEAIIDSFAVFGAPGQGAIQVHNGGHLYVQTGLVGSGNAVGLWVADSGLVRMSSGMATCVITGSVANIQGPLANLTAADLPRLWNFGGGTFVLGAGGTGTATVVGLPADAVVAIARKGAAGTPGVVDYSIAGNVITFQSDNALDRSTYGFIWRSAVRGPGGIV